MEPRQILENFWTLRAGNTARQYACILRGWEDFIKKDILSALSVDALGYIALLKSQKKSDATIRAHFHGLRSMYGVLNDMALIPINPFRQIARTVNLRSKRQVRPTKMIPFDQVFRIMNSCGNTLEGLRDRAILACIFGGGLRRSEVHQLNIGDLRASKRGIYVLLLRNTKAGVLQEQILPKWAGRWVNDYLLKRTGEVPTDPLFTFIHSDERQRNKRLSVETIYRIYKRQLKKISIDAAPHSGRKTAGSRLKQQGREDREVAGFLRHSTTREVKTYDGRFKDALEEVAKNLDYPKKISCHRK